MKGVLFDWDGTLVNSESLLMRIWQKAAEPMGRSIDERKFLPLIGLFAREIAVTLFPDDPPETTDSLLAQRLQVYDEFYNQAKPYPDAGECLEGLFQNTYRMAIMTSNSAARIQTRLRSFRVGEIFFIRGRGRHDRGGEAERGHCFGGGSGFRFCA